MIGWWRWWWWWWGGQNPNTSFGILSVGILSVGVYSAHHEEEGGDDDDEGDITQDGGQRQVMSKLWLLPCWSFSFQRRRFCSSTVTELLVKRLGMSWLVVIGSPVIVVIVWKSVWSGQTVCVGLIMDKFDDSEIKNNPIKKITVCPLAGVSRWLYLCWHLILTKIWSGLWLWSHLLFHFGSELLVLNN